MLLDVACIFVILFGNCDALFLAVSDSISAWQVCNRHTSGSSGSLVLENCMGSGRAKICTGSPNDVEGLVAIVRLSAQPNLKFEWVSAWFKWDSLVGLQSCREQPDDPMVP